MRPTDDTLMLHYAGRSSLLLALLLAVFSGFALAGCSPATSDDRTGSAGSAPTSAAGGNAPAGSAEIVTTASTPAIPVEERETVTPLAARPAAPTPPRDADQEFLRHMLDHSETVLAIVHARMMEPAGHGAHGKSADPAAWDAKIDAGKQEMLTLLKKHYDEEYAPRAALPASTVIPGSSRGMAGMPMPTGSVGEREETESMAARMTVAARLRDGADLVDRFTPRLKRPAVRDLARRLRASQLQLAREIGAGMQSR